jgi:FtsH-binding integral membrane protein
MDNTPQQPPVFQPLLPTDERLRIGPILRDVVIVWVFTFLGGFVVGVATGGPSHDAKRYILALAVSNILFGTIGFTIAGCLAPSPRWRHLRWVALGAWLTGLVNVAFLHVSIAQWINGAIFVVLITGLGGAISYLFKRDTKPSA